MGVIPAGKPDQIEFFENRIEQWITNAALIGLDPLDLPIFKDQITAARGKFTGAQAARTTSKNATQAYHVTTDEMTDAGRGFVATIKAYAEKTGNLNVYNLASIPQPKEPSPAAPPETPTMLRAAIRATDGATILEWDGSTLGGVTFTIFRSIFDGATFPAPVLVGSLGGERTFVDLTIPSCTQAAQYSVKAWRGGKSSAFSEPLVFRYTPGVAPGDQQQAMAA